MKTSTRTNVSRRIIVAAFAAVGLAVTSCGGGTSAPKKVHASSLDDLYQQAKKEGEVVFWGPEDHDDVAALAKVFNKRFPGIAVKDFEITSDEMAPKIITESHTGKLSMDAAEGGIGSIKPLLDRNLIARHDDWSKFMPLPKDAVLLHGRTLAWYNNTHPIAYNTDLVSLSEVPKSWDDLLDPKWKGKIILEPRAKAFSQIGVVEGKQALIDYMKRLKSQQPIFVKGGTTTATQLAAGQAPIAVGSYGYKINLLRDEKHAPVDWVPTSPLGANQEVVYTVVGARHPAAAQLWTDWLASKQGLAAHMKINGKGSVLAGSDAEKIKASHVKLVVESPENTDKLAAMEDVAAATLGAVK